MFCRVLFPGNLVRGWLLLLAVGTLSTSAAYGERRWSRPASPKNGPSAVETTNFRIYGLDGTTSRWQVGEQLEALRGRLCRAWLAADEVPTWSPKCDVVVHATAGSYLKAVGQEHLATLGASRIDLSGGRVALRRIDIRADRTGWFAAVVPHELTHVILADEFLGGNLPHWADEGMATLADTSLKRSLHLRDFDSAWRRGSAFRLSDLLRQTSYPSAGQIQVFYGQSVSLVEFLVGRKGPAEFVSFLHLMEKTGCHAAIGESYGFRSVADLERQWFRWLQASSRVRTVLVAYEENRP